MSGPKVESIRKRIIKIFNDCGLNFTIKINLRIVDFLDVCFDFINNTYRCFCKSNNEAVYMHKQSNHPPNILKELPKSKNKRFSDISCDENIFNNAKLTLKLALKNGRFTETISYIKPSDQNINNREAKKKRKWKIIWYNPPFSLKIKTNVGKLLFKILRKNFPKTNSPSEIFNKNTVKISHSCTRNVKSIISGHNKQILHPKPQPYGCNSRDKNNCLLDNKWLMLQIVYQAVATNDTDDIYKYYLGLAETS